jgi:hypothetical protein
VTFWTCDPYLRLGAWDSEVCNISEVNLNSHVGVHRHWRETYIYYRGQYNIYGEICVALPDSFRFNRVQGDSM